MSLKVSAPEMVDKIPYIVLSELWTSRIVRTFLSHNHIHGSVVPILHTKSSMNKIGALAGFPMQ